MSGEFDKTGRRSASSDRRVHVRVRVPAVVTLFVDAVKVGDYLVRNLSIGGALLSGQTGVPSGATVRLLLSLPCTRYAGAIGAEVLRTEPDVEGGVLIGVVFRDIVASVRSAIESVVTEEIGRQTASSILLLDARIPALGLLARAVGQLNRRVLLARSALEMMRALVDRSARVEVVVSSGPLDDSRALQLLGIVAEDFPATRRILIADPDSTRFDPWLASGDLHGVLPESFTIEQFTRALALADSAP